MQNVKMNMLSDGKTLRIEVDTSRDFGPSKSGKTITVASTKGNADVPGHEGLMKIGLNVYKYFPRG